ncbi:hypothetical protein [Heyndrickxia oleronia]|uniref:hypothetical protein n=1 Tax=Heyndrickxia oleronia TaxID=38875 RepID=UPI001C0EC8C1|nr:hypothetical protein [Heyndrickxia oleronia]MBU5211044.1 hypothetical protein [Heyndrickxia oleronia]
MKSELITVGLTVLSGLLLFISSQYFLKCVLEPIMEVRKTIGEISYQIIMYANRFSNVADMNALSDNTVGPEIRAIGKEVRSLSARLVGNVQIVPMYRFFSILRFVPSRKRINAARAHLIGLSNSLVAYSESRNEYNKNNLESMKEIRKALRLRDK